VLEGCFPRGFALYGAGMEAWDVTSRYGAEIRFSRATFRVAYCSTASPSAEPSSPLVDGVLFGTPDGGAPAVPVCAVASCARHRPRTAADPLRNTLEAVLEVRGSHIRNVHVATTLMSMLPSRGSGEMGCQQAQQKGSTTLVRNRLSKWGRRFAIPFLTTYRTAGWTILLGGFLAGISLYSAGPVRHQLSSAFQANIMAAVGPESPLELRLFTGPVKTDSRGRIITGPNSNDPVKTIVGAESAGIRAGLERFTKILFPVQLLRRLARSRAAGQSECAVSRQWRPALAAPRSAVPGLAQFGRADAGWQQDLCLAAGPRRLSGLAHRLREYGHS
jgi:hypothetical protein